jgi:ELWxxDGT repeat protein
MTKLLNRIFVLLALLVSTCDQQAQDFTTSQRIADINPGGAGSFPSNLTAFGSSLVFSAYTDATGRELWKYDGNAVTLLTNINDTTHDDGTGYLIGNDSVPDWLTLFNGALYFSAYDQRRGGELWRYDGTRASRVADINPDVNDNIKLNPNSSWPQELTVMGNALYFSADNSGFLLPNYELWKYDGIKATMVTNIHADIGIDHSSYPNHLKAINNTLYFMADDGVNGYELWKHDSNGTVLLKNINPGGVESSSFPKYFTPYRNKVYFQAFDDSVGYELWTTDGTNTSLVSDINPLGSSSPEGFIVYKDTLCFRANDGQSGVELWKYDGTNVTLIADLNPAGDSSPKNLTVFQDNLYFAANDGTHGWELWKYDGTTTSLVEDLNPGGDSFPEELMVWNDRLYFTATNAALGFEVWKFDGRRISVAADINPGPASSFPFHLAGRGSEVCFSANNSFFSDWELWSVKLFRFDITRIEPWAGNMRITWETMGGSTNVVQAAGSPAGEFQDVGSPIRILGNGQCTTNYIDVSMNPTSRFYRIVQP